jgi:serine protease Do
MAVSLRNIVICSWFIWVLLSPTGYLSFAGEKAETLKASAPDLTTVIADVAQRAMPAVMHIEVIQRVPVQGPSSPFESDPFFRYFFGGSPGRKKEMRGIGTGTLIDADGNILTNHHVVSGATRIIVKTPSGEEMEAKLVGADPKTDLAVIRVKAVKNIQYLTFGNSDKIRIGEWVVAIGHPRGLEQTVTAGIISAKHRTGILDPSSYQDYIQTDAAINPGNSGGPLLNLAGEVVGINAAIVSESGGFEGIGFAIPSNMAAAITESLIKTGRVTRGWLGVNVQEVTASLARSLNLKGTRGALVTELVKGGPADRSGVKPGDLVTALDGYPVENANDFRNRVATSRIGRKMEIAILRKGERVAVNAVVASYKALPAAAGMEARSRLGLEVKEISALDARRKRLESREGVMVSRVDPSGPAERAGLEPGDILYQINNNAVRSVKDYHRILEQVQAEEEILVLVRDLRTGQVGYLTLILH